MINTKVFTLIAVLGQAAMAAQAGPYFQNPDNTLLQRDFGYVPVADNPWAPPTMAPAYEPTEVPVYEAPAQDFSQSGSERYITEEELRRLESVTDEASLWHGSTPSVSRPLEQQADAYSSMAYERRQNDDAWGQFDTRDLIGNSGYRPLMGNRYAPYNFGVPGVYPPVPGWGAVMPGAGQTYYPNSVYNLTMPRLDTRTMDGINSGSYLNNSIAPFLY